MPVDKKLLQTMHRQGMSIAEIESWVKKSRGEKDLILGKMGTKNKVLKS